MKITKSQILNMIKEELEDQAPSEEEEEGTPLNKAQSINLRAYTSADPKERTVISQLEASLLQLAGDANLLADPAVVRALKLLNQALGKAG